MAKQSIFDQYVDDIRDLIGISQKDFEILAQNRDFFEKYADALLDHIDEVLSAHAGTRSVFEEGRGDAQRLRGSVARWLMGILESGSDSFDFWRRQYVIGYQHIKRKIPNRHMIGLGNRIKAFAAPAMVAELGPERGMELFLALHRLLDMIIALTCTLVEEGQRRCLEEATGFSPQLRERLEQTTLDKFRDEF